MAYRPTGTIRSLPPLPEQPQAAALGIEVVDVEPDGLGDAGTGAVQELQQGPVAQLLGGTAFASGGQERLDLVDSERLRQPSWRRGWADVGSGVGGGQLFETREAVEPTHGDDGAGGRGGRERLVLGVALAEATQEGQHVALGHLVGGMDPDLGQEGLVARKVAPVGRQRVASQTPFDGEVVEVLAERERQRRRSLRRRRRARVLAMSGP